MFQRRRGHTASTTYLEEISKSKHAARVGTRAAGEMARGGGGYSIQWERCQLSGSSRRRTDSSRQPPEEERMGADSSWGLAEGAESREWNPR